jgi:hypothetical protein
VLFVQGAPVNLLASTLSDNILDVGIGGVGDLLVLGMGGGALRLRAFSGRDLSSLPVG